MKKKKKKRNKLDFLLFIQTFHDLSILLLLQYSIADELQKSQIFLSHSIESVHTIKTVKSIFSILKNVLLRTDIDADLGSSNKIIPWIEKFNADTHRRPQKICSMKNSGTLFCQSQKDWLDRCNSLRQLDFNSNYRLKYDLKNAMRVSYFPTSFGKLKVENRELHDMLSVKIDSPYYSQRNEL